MLYLSPISPCIPSLYMSKCYISPFFNFLSGVYTLGYAVLTEMGFLVFRMLMGVRAGSGRCRKTPDPRLHKIWYAWHLMPQHIVISYNCTFTKISRSQQNGLHKSVFESILLDLIIEFGVRFIGLIYK